MRNNEIELARIDFNHPRGGATSALLLMGTYASSIGTPSLRLSDPETGEPLWIVSSNLADYGVEPDEFCTFFKGYAENEGLLEVLVASGLVECTGRCVQTEHVNFPEVKINASAEGWAEFKKLCRRAANPTEPDHEVN